MKKNVNISKIVFYSIYAFFVLLIIGGIVFVTVKLYNFLDNYERSLDKYEAEEIFNEYFSPCRFDKLYDMQEITLSEFEDKDDFVSYMEKQIEGKTITYREVPAGLGQMKKYRVFADKVCISEFILKENTSPKTPEETWALDTVNTIYTTSESVKIKSFKTSKITINGIELKEDYITTDNIETESCKRVPEGVNGIMYREYEVNNLLFAPEIKITDRHGNEGTLVYDEEHQMFVEQMNYDVFTEEIKTLTQDAAQTYAKYMTLDASLYNFRKYFDTKSKIYKNITTTEIKWFTPHIGYEFKDIEFKDYYIYDENTFSARYVCNHYLYRTSAESRLFPLDLTLYFKNINGTFYVYDMISNK
ncbi:MAG: hypothetical protein E7574_01145 [Ruminococcaceae bacterium]|nr:hypothetical protein [Oscillospiraceae bacterium]